MQSSGTHAHLSHTSSFNTSHSDVAEVNSQLPGIQWNSSSILMLAILCCICVGTILGNLLTVVVICVRPRLHSSHNLLILSLALADLTVGAVVMPLKSAVELLGWWPFGDCVCSLWMIVSKTCGTASVYALVCIAIERYHAVVYPIWYQQRTSPQRRALVYITITWLLSVAIGSLSLSGWLDPPYGQIDGLPQCRVYPRASYTYFVALCVFLLPTILMIVLYVRIYQGHNRQCNALHRTTPSAVNRSSSPPTEDIRLPQSASVETGANVVCDDISGEPTSRCQLQRANFESSSDSGCVSITVSAAKLNHHQHTTKFGRVARLGSSTNKYRRDINRQRRAFVILGLLLGCFCVCLIPFITNSLVVTVCPTCLTPSNVRVSVLLWMAYVNSLLNPLIYVLMSTNIRQQLFQALRLKRTL